MKYKNDSIAKTGPLNIDGSKVIMLTIFALEYYLCPSPNLELFMWAADLGSVFALDLTCSSTLNN